MIQVCTSSSAENVTPGMTQTPISRNGTQTHGERNCYGLWNIEKRFIAKFAQLPITLETPIGKNTTNLQVIT